MDKLIRISDVLALLPTDDTVGPKPSALRKAIEALPTVDAVEVVRCKNCERSLKIPDEGIFCSIWGRGWCRMEPDDFCPHGERRGDNGR